MTDGAIKRKMASIFVDQVANGSIKSRNLNLASDILKSSLSDRPGLEQICIRAVELSQGIKSTRCKYNEFLLPRIIASVRD